MDDAARPARLSDHWRGLVLALVALLGLAVAVALVYIVLDANTARDRAIERRSHSFEVMILTRSLGENLASAEASLGRFVISGDRRLGVRFERDWARAQRQIGDLRRLASDNRLQLARIDRMATAYAQRTGELTRVAALSDDRFGGNGLTAYYDVRDTAALGRIDDALGEVLAAERALLDARSIQLDATIDRSNRLGAGLLAFGFVLLGVGLVAGWNLLLALAARRAADAEAADERARAAELEAAVSAATERLRAEQTDRIAAEAKLAQAQKMEAIGQLTGGIAHDFNNMLAVVLGGIELAERHLPAGSEAARHLTHAAEGGHRAAALTRQLLAFARVEALAPEAIDPAALIDGMAPLLDRTLGDGVRVETRHDHRDWSIWADRHQLENALLNLAVNARDAMEGRGVLTIATRGAELREGEVGACAAGDYVAIGVHDDGHGMTPQVQARVFEPFFTTKPAGKGTGLGLSQVFGTIRQLGGDVAIDSSPGRGTTVTLYVPRRAAGAASPARPVDPAIHDARSAQLDILVVEDDPRVLRSTVAALAELGHRPVACADPFAAPAAIAAMPALDLIVSDVVMPGRSGPEMVAALRAARPGLRVLFVTGFAGDIDDDALGGERVLRKPFTLAALGAAVSVAAGG